MRIGTQAHPCFSFRALWGRPLMRGSLSIISRLDNRPVHQLHAQGFYAFGVPGPAFTGPSQAGFWTPLSPPFDGWCGGRVCGSRREVARALRGSQRSKGVLWKHPQKGSGRHRLTHTDDTNWKMDVFFHWHQCQRSVSFCQQIYRSALEGLFINACIQLGCPRELELKCETEINKVQYSPPDQIQMLCVVLNECNFILYQN